MTDDYRYHADRLIDVTILPDYHSDAVANSVWVNYIENGEPRKTNAPDLVLDKASREKVVALLKSAIESLTDKDNG